MNGILMLIRNSRTSAFLNNGGTGVEIVQQMLGHSDIATTMIYAEVDQSKIHEAYGLEIVYKS